VLAAGNYPARVVQVIDLGLQNRPAWKGQEKPPCNQVWVTYELPTEFMLDEDGNEDDTRPRWVSEKMNLFSMSQENATSTKRLKGLDPNDTLDGDWSRAIGMPCTLTVVNKEYKGNTYANVGGVTPPMKGMIIPDLINEGKVFMLDEPDMEMFNDLPDFLKDMITANIEFKGSPLEQAMLGGDDGDRPY